MKDKQWKDYWDVDLGVSYIPIDKLDPQVNMALLEEGGMFDDDTMPEWMKTMRGVAPTFAQQQQQQQQQQLMGQPPAQAPQPQHPQFIPIPDGLVPPTTAGTVGEIPHPPGLPPFGIPPPGAPPALAGLLAPPHGPAGMLPAAPPPSILLGPPLGPPPAGAPGVLGGPPPGFPPPGFDASQPPPGLRLPGFPPPSAAPAAAGIPPPSALTGAPLGGPPPGNNAIVNASAGNKGESSMDMDVEEEPPQRPKERRNRERQSRWGSKEPASADEGNKGGPPPINTGLPPSNGPPPKHDSNNGPPNSQREGNGPNGSSTLANRLRSLAGFGGQGGPENNDGGGNGSRGPPEMWQQQQNGMDGPPMGKSANI